jgi:heme exporter protein A
MNLQSLTATNLTCLRGGRLVFRDLSFAVERGQALSLEGANGAGKSSLLRMIAGFLTPAAGTLIARTNDAEIADAEDRGKCIGWLGHLDAAKPQMTVRETLAFFASFYASGASASAIVAALDRVGLTRLADLPCQYLSMGQKKRLALARLVLSNRPLWLMDEPLAALDTSGKTIVADLVTTHCKTGGLAILATHEPLGIDSTRLTLGAA